MKNNSLPTIHVKGTLFTYSKGKSRLLLLDEASILTLINAKIKRVLVELHGIQFHLAIQNSKELGRYLMLNADIMTHYLKHGGSLSGEMTVHLTPDNSELKFKPSEALNEVLSQDAEAFKAFELLTDGKKRGLIYFIEQAKSIEIRIKRALLTAEKLKEDKYLAKTKRQ